MSPKKRDVRCEAVRKKRHGVVVRRERCILFDGHKGRHIFSARFQ